MPPELPLYAVPVRPAGGVPADRSPTVETVWRGRARRERPWVTLRDIAFPVPLVGVAMDGSGGCGVRVTDLRAPTVSERDGWTLDCARHSRQRFRHCAAAIVDRAVGSHRWHSRNNARLREHPAQLRAAESTETNGRCWSPTANWASGT
ncbi:hypothetical protein GCM10027089_41400 [Nocardia thraciensis]